MSEPQNGRGALFTGGLAAILASACCLGPLVLIALGFSGAWIGNLTVLEPYRPIFIGVALVALFFGAMICITAVMLPLTPVRIVRVLVLGACGFAVVGMYVIYQAPDLALTQLFFEIISVLVFVLVLRMLPSERKTKSPLLRARIPVAAAAGLGVGWLTLMAAGTDPEQRLGRWFTRMTYKGPELADGTYAHGGGGFNIVNVILVDFRGFDTLGEIGVLGLAALGVWSMLAGRGRRRRLDDGPTTYPAPDFGVRRSTPATAEAAR